MNDLLSKLYLGSKFEKELTFYKRIGVIFFKKIVPTGGDFWIKIINKRRKKKFRVIKNREDAIAWTIFTIIVEGIHGMGFLIMNYFIIKVLLNQRWETGMFLIVLNILINIYPIFIQRYNRIRMIQIFGIEFKELKNCKVEIK